MCVASSLTSQYKTSKDSEATNKQYNDGLNDNYRRWTSEDLQRTGEMDRINQRVSEAEAGFNSQRDSIIAQKEAEMKKPGYKPTPTFGLHNLNSISTLRGQKFNAEGMRGDLMREAALKRVQSGVYSRNYLTADVPTAQVSVIGGGANRGSRPSGGSSGPTRGGSGASRAGLTGVKLNIGT